MPIKIIEKFSNVFVETGTFYGEGIQVAINAGYEKIISIEIFKKYFDFGTKRFALNKNIKVVLGDSSLILGETIKDINEPITFWLDGHCSGEGTGLGTKYYPLMEELEHIQNHPLKTHIIMIDDIRLWKEYDKELNFQSVINKLLTINPAYSIYTMDGIVESTILPNDILIAKLD